MKNFINIETKYQPKDRKELIDLVEDLSIKLWEIDTSLITDMTYLFCKNIRSENEDFKGIDLWDVSNVKSMAFMFYNCYNFNQNINGWDISNVIDMRYMFCDCANFNQPLDKWNISKVENTDCMFYGCENFNQPLDILKSHSVTGTII